MSAAPNQSASPPAEHAVASREAQLRAASRRFQLDTAKLDPVPASRVLRGYHTVWDAVAPWLDLARQRLAEAVGSPADSTRWQHLLAALAEPVDRRIAQPTFDRLVTLRGKGVDLFRVLIEAEKPGPKVAEIADQIHRAIKDQQHWPGQRLAAHKIAVELSAPTERVKLALRDLADAGIVTLSSSGRASVAAPAPAASRPETVARWLTALIEHGVYPPGRRLPRRPDLARSLVSSTAHVTAAVHQLRNSGLLTVASGHATVAATAAAQPLDVQSVITQLPPAPAAETAADIRRTAAAAHQLWLHQVVPSPNELRHVFRTLQRTTAGLLSAATPLTDLDRETQTAVRRAAATAIAPLPASPQERTWRTACLGAALLDVLARVEPDKITGQALLRLTSAERRIAVLPVTGKADRQIATLST
ncbi:GntR family transcriptional regulator [Streptomyces sp. UH6]|uniref:GntR family transcriptional regulator n=1 Tax=Streptomyces sp. UH6 TaxID=2748379 RepID=UPI0015D4CB08|nr:GntR family transcriptional regulator [Streptomyces sp. UH6]NYV72813.1 GntR family transcriptional regulator [Streptomyces sp. UH6]